MIHADIAGTEFTRCGSCMGAKQLCPGCFVNEKSIGKLRSSLAAMDAQLISIESQARADHTNLRTVIDKLESRLKKLKAKGKKLEAIELIVRST